MASAPTATDRTVSFPAQVGPAMLEHPEQRHPTGDGVECKRHPTRGPRDLRPPTSRGCTGTPCAIRATSCSRSARTPPSTCASNESGSRTRATATTRACLDKLARYFADLAPRTTSRPRRHQPARGVPRPPVGRRRPPHLQQERCRSSGISSSTTILRGDLQGDPTLADRAAPAPAGSTATTFSSDQIRAIIAGQDNRRDRICLRAPPRLRDRARAPSGTSSSSTSTIIRKRLTIFTKGEKIRELPIAGAAFWLDLERHIVDSRARPHDYLLCRGGRRPNPGSPPPDVHHRDRRDKPISDHGTHDWWYRASTRAGVVAQGTTRGERMHKARHSAGQRVLDDTGNFKAVQKLLGHSRSQTTGDIYADWDVDQLAQTMADGPEWRTSEAETRSFPPCPRLKNRVLQGEPGFPWRRWESNPRNVPPDEPLRFAGVRRGCGR